ncbi:MAG: endo-1,4-beta-xylanase [Treponema sp.]|jgi:endo-1,4-beta-xylanase|nr:endo-1,4-beta-xylanase [Treponema sp.]
MKQFLVIVMTLAAVTAFAQAGNVTVIDTNFENGMDGWGPRGDNRQGLEKLEVTNAVKHGGSSALRVFNRTHEWQGATRKLAASAVGDMFSVEAWLYYKDGPSKITFVFSTQKTSPSGQAYQNVLQTQANKGEWVQIKGEFTVAKDPTITDVQVYFETPKNDTVEFYLDDVKFVKLDPSLRPKAEVNIPNLRDKVPFDIGAAVSVDDVDFSSEWAQLLMKHFSILVAGNEMKRDTVEPSEGKYNWGPADKIVDFAMNTGNRVRWHTLVWHSQNPDWLFKGAGATKAGLDQRMKTYIQTVMRKYRGDVDSYDVVNEVLDENGKLRNSEWLRIIGPEYINNAFRYAREADPKAQLVINDYNLASNPRKRQGMYDLVKDLKARGVPVDAIGMQMHIDIKNPSVSAIKETIELFASLGVKVLVTEMDMSIYTSDTEPKKTVTPAILQEQATRYRAIFDVFKEEYQKKNLDAVVIWGTSDNLSWKNDFPTPGRTDAPLLFDSKLKRKPAFDAIVR